MYPHSHSLKVRAFILYGHHTAVYIVVNIQYIKLLPRNKMKGTTDGNNLMYKIYRLFSAEDERSGQGLVEKLCRLMWRWEDDVRISIGSVRLRIGGATAGGSEYGN